MSSELHNNHVRVDRIGHLGHGKTMVYKAVKLALMGINQAPAKPIECSHVEKGDR